MTENRLIEFKRQINALRKPVAAINGIWKNEDVAVVQILLQNLGFNALGCVGVTIESEEKKIQKIIEAIKEIANYSSNSPTLKWVVSEIELAYMATQYED